MKHSLARPAGGDSGFSLVEMMVSVAVLSVSFYMVSGVFGGVVNTMSTADTRDALANVRDAFGHMITDNASWQKTMSAAANQATFQCWINGTDCRGKGGNFTPYDAQGKLFQTTTVKGSGQVVQTYDPAVANNGFNLSGQACTGYAANNANCSVRVTFQWSAACPPVGSCYKPEIDVKLNFVMPPPLPNKAAVSVADLNKDLRIPGNSVPVNMTSAGAGGKQTCPSGNWKTGQIVVGVNPANGQLVCANANQLLYGGAAYWP